MADHELLNAISSMLDEKLALKLEPIYTKITGMKSEIAEIKENMVTKEDLRRTENMILAQVDFVQEKANDKFKKLGICS